MNEWRSAWSTAGTRSRDGKPVQIQAGVVREYDGRNSIALTVGDEVLKISDENTAALREILLWSVTEKDMLDTQDERARSNRAVLSRADWDEIRHAIASRDLSRADELMRRVAAPEWAEPAETQTSHTLIYLRCTACGTDLANPVPAIHVAEETAYLADNGCIVRGERSNPDEMRCQECTIAAWLGKTDLTLRPVSFTTLDASWAGTSAASVEVWSSGDQDTKAEMRDAYDNNVLMTLTHHGVDPRALDPDERARLIADAMASVDVDQLAEEALRLHR